MSSLPFSTWDPQRVPHDSTNSLGSLIWISQISFLGRMPVWALSFDLRLKRCVSNKTTTLVYKCPRIVVCVVIGKS